MLRFKQYLLRELTVSPDYRQRNVFNPFYDMSDKIVKDVTKQLKQKIKDEENEIKREIQLEQIPITILPDKDETHIETDSDNETFNEVKSEEVNA